MSIPFTSSVSPLSIHKAPAFYCSGAWVFSMRYGGFVGVVCVGTITSMSIFALFIDLEVDADAQMFSSLVCHVREGPFRDMIQGFDSLIYSILV
jgi:hypothetical protein